MFDDFKVEVHYPDDYTRFVTKKAIRGRRSRRPPPVTRRQGNSIGLRPGTTNVTAEFQGLASQVPLTVVVTPDVEIDEIAVELWNLPMRPGETHELRAIGYKDGKSAGDITGLGNLTWKSSNPDAARLSGNSVTAGSLGQSEVTVERKGLTWNREVRPRDRFHDDCRRSAGRSRHDPDGRGASPLGNDDSFLRGGLDVSQQAMAVPESPGVVRFDPATRTLYAIGEGSVPLGITMGDKGTRVQVVGGREASSERQQARRRAEFGGSGPRTGRSLEGLRGKPQRGKDRDGGRLQVGRPIGGGR